MKLKQYFTKAWTGGISLIKGLSVTFSYFINPKKIITEQYPENRKTLKMTPRFRGQVIMPHDEQGEHKCTACSMCERACPNGSISILATKNIASKRVLGQFIYRYDQCTLCNLCIEACPFDAIEMGPGFENAVYDRSELIMVLNKKEGR
ncbi:MAG: NADH-quinone oxidoreductase subunit I [Fibrobacter sp.]|nr:NADH-quinone oxidoreductase subunit I [Fibrobacter sp.]